MYLAEIMKLYTQVQIFESCLGLKNNSLQFYEDKKQTKFYKNEIQNLSIQKDEKYNLPI